MNKTTNITTARYEKALKDIVRLLNVASTKPRNAWTLNEAAEIGNRCGGIARTALSEEDRTTKRDKAIQRARDILDPETDND